MTTAAARNTSDVLRFPFRQLARTGFVVFAVALMLLSVVAPALAQATEFSDLVTGQRVYDRTGNSLSESETADVLGRLQELTAIGADAIVYVRDLDATPEETLEQVEALQQAWVAATGSEQDTAIAVLINRNPEDDTDARAGMFAGRTYFEGNLPEGEQLAIVNDALIPPLRDGDVHGSLIAGLDRMTRSIRNGPPPDPFEEWATDATSTWLPWTLMGLAAVGFAAAALLFGRRETTEAPDQPPTTARPIGLSPAVAGALALGGPGGATIQSTLLDLAGRDALAIEPEHQGGRFSQPTIQVRLLARTLVHDSDPVEATVWNGLEDRAESGIVTSKQLKKFANAPKAVKTAMEEQMSTAGWLNPSASIPRGLLLGIGILAVILATPTFAAIVVSGNWFPTIVGVVALVLLFVTCLILFSRFSPLSRLGQTAAIPWKAYRDGLKGAARDKAVQLDLDAVLADAVALGLTGDFKDRLEAAGEAGEPLKVFTSATSPLSPAEQDAWVQFAWWPAFMSSTFSTTGTGAGAASGAGAGGGGGAAGST